MPPATQDGTQTDHENSGEEDDYETQLSEIENIQASTIPGLGPRPVDTRAVRPDASSTQSTRNNRRSDSSLGILAHETPESSSDGSADEDDREEARIAIMEAEAQAIEVDALARREHIFSIEPETMYISDSLIRKCLADGSDLPFKASSKRPCLKSLRDLLQLESVKPCGRCHLVKPDYITTGNSLNTMGLCGCVLICFLDIVHRQLASQLPPPKVLQTLDEMPCPTYTHGRVYQVVQSAQAGL